MHTDISSRKGDPEKSVASSVSGAWPPWDVALGVEVLGMVLDVLGHEGAHEEVAVVIALQEHQQSG